MDVAAAVLPAFVALWLLSPWPLLGSVQGQFSAGEWSEVGGGGFGSVAVLSLGLLREEGLADSRSWGSGRRSLWGWGGLQVEARSVLGVCVRRDEARSWAPWGSGNFYVRHPLFPRLAGRADSPGYAGRSLWRPCFSWASGAVRATLVREERKKYLGLTGPRFFGSPNGLVALCRQTVQKLPGKPLSELWGTRRD